MIIVVSKCVECPFMAVAEGERVCNIAVPYQRSVGEDDERPSWCKLRKEQVIVRDFK